MYYEIFKHGSTALPSCPTFLIATSHIPIRLHIALADTNENSLLPDVLLGNLLPKQQLLVILRREE